MSDNKALLTMMRHVEEAMGNIPAPMPPVPQLAEKDLQMATIKKGGYQPSGEPSNTTPPGQRPSQPAPPPQSSDLDAVLQIMTLDEVRQAYGLEPLNVSFDTGHPRRSFEEAIGSSPPPQFPPNRVVPDLERTWVHGQPMNPDLLWVDMCFYVVAAAAVHGVTWAMILWWL